MPPTKTIRQRASIPAPPKQVYEAILTPRQHAAFTGAPATGTSRVGGRFTAYDGYILGVHRALEPERRIVQEWWTTEWPDEAAPSLVEWSLKRAPGGTELRLVHSKVPASQADSYRQGWVDYYWTPLKAYFAQRAARSGGTAGRRVTGQRGATASRRTGRHK